MEDLPIPVAALGLRPLRDLSTPGSDQDERYNHR